MSETEKSTATVPEPEAKKAKTSMNKYPEAPDEEWPEAWLMTEETGDGSFDQCKPNKRSPNVPVDAAALRALGIQYWKLDPTAYEYPVKAIPWDPKDATDPKLAALRDDRGYNYADIITIHPDHLPEFDKKIAAFFEEHIHDAGKYEVIERRKARGVIFYFTVVLYHTCTFAVLLLT
jgi:1,2-dihydroxy-3-keto-5-methylthiopentene dioxygenase